MNVLSLFGGIECGLQALKQAETQVTNYYSSEVNKYAIQISKKNHPEIIHLGDITKWQGWGLPKIDLLIGGSPCQGFSFAGKQLNFNDPRSALFFEYVNILNHLKPKYFLFENVKMKKEYQDVISGLLGVEPILINSALVSAQNRNRLYWTNIPGVEQPADKGILLKDILECGIEIESLMIPDCKTINRIYKKQYLQYDINGKGHGSQDQRAYYLNGKHGCLDTGANGKSKILLSSGRVRKTTRLEKERLQTLPCGYTNGISEDQAAKAGGNGWTVKVIEHIFNGIK